MCERVLFIEKGGWSLELALAGKGGAPVKYLHCHFCIQKTSLSHLILATFLACLLLIWLQRILGILLLVLKVRHTFKRHVGTV